MTYVFVYSPTYTFCFPLNKKHCRTFWVRTEWLGTWSMYFGVRQVLGSWLGHVASWEVAYLPVFAPCPWSGDDICLPFFVRIKSIKCLALGLIRVVAWGRHRKLFMCFSIHRRDVNMYQLCAYVCRSAHESLLSVTSSFASEDANGNAPRSQVSHFLTLVSLWHIAPS